MELKLTSPFFYDFSNASSNRTFMELKYYNHYNNNKNR